jgi:hypothetical protein
VGQIQCFRRMAGTFMAGLAAVGCVAVVFLAEPVAVGSEAVEAPSGCFGISSITPTSNRVRCVRSRIMADGRDETDSFLVNPTERSTTPGARAFPPGFLTASDSRDQTTAQMILFHARPYAMGNVDMQSFVPDTRRSDSHSSKRFRSSR